TSARATRGRRLRVSAAGPTQRFHVRLCDCASLGRAAAAAAAAGAQGCTLSDESVPCVPSEAIVGVRDAMLPEPEPRVFRVTLKPGLGTAQPEAVSPRVHIYVKPRP